MAVVRLVANDPDGLWVPGEPSSTESIGSLPEARQAVRLSIVEAIVVASSYEAGWAIPLRLGHGSQGRVETVHVVASVALVTEQHGKTIISLQAELTHLLFGTRDGSDFVRRL